MLVEVINPHAIYEYTRMLIATGPLNINLSNTPLGTSILVEEISSINIAPLIAPEAYFFSSILFLADRFRKSESGGFFPPSGVDMLKGLLEQNGWLVQVTTTSRVEIAAIIPEGDFKAEISLGFRDMEAAKRDSIRMIDPSEVHIRDAQIFEKISESFLSNEGYTLVFKRNSEINDGHFELTNKDDFRVQIESYADFYGKVITAIHDAQGMETPRAHIFLSVS